MAVLFNIPKVGPLHDQSSITLLYEGNLMKWRYFFSCWKSFSSIRSCSSVCLIYLSSKNMLMYIGQQTLAPPPLTVSLSVNYPVFFLQLSLTLSVYSSVPWEPSNRHGGWNLCRGHRASDGRFVSRKLTSLSPRIVMQVEKDFLGIIGKANQLDFICSNSTRNSYVTWTIHRKFPLSI